MKSSWVMIILVIAGAGILVLSIKPKHDPSRSVVLQEVFHQEPAGSQPAEAVVPAAEVPAVSPVGDPVTAPAIVTNPRQGQGTDFMVQVYSFQDRTRADKALADLKQVGYKAFMEVSDLGEKGVWYRVRIGGIKNEQEAQAMLEKIRKEYKSGFIVKPKA